MRPPTNNINKTWDLLQITGGNDGPNIVLMRNLSEHHNKELMAYIYKHLLMCTRSISLAGF